MSPHHTALARWLVLLLPAFALFLALRLLDDDNDPEEEVAQFDATRTDDVESPVEILEHVQGPTLEPIRLRGAADAAAHDASPADIVPAVDERPSFAHVDGMVTGPDGRAVEGARVSLRGMLDDRTPATRALRATTTDPYGAFRLAPVPAGRFAVWAEADGRAPAWRANVAPGTRLELRLADAGRLRVTATDAAGAPASGASVRVRRPGFFRDAETDADGVAEMDGLPAGPAELRVVTKPCGLVTRTVRIDPTATFEVTCRIAPSTRLVGTVREHGTGEAIADAEVRVLLVDHPDLEPQTTCTDARGGFVLLAPFAAGTRLEARAAKAGYADGTARLLAPVDGAEDARVVIAMRPQRLLAGRVEDAVGRAVSSARVWWPGDGGSAATTDVRGRFRLALPAAGAARGAHALAARTSRGAFGAAGVDLDAPDDVVIVLRGAGRIAGTISDAAGRPVEGAHVRLELVSTADAVDETVEEAWARGRGVASLESSALASVTGADGAYAVPAVPAGTWRVRVTHRLGVHEPAEAVVVAPGETTRVDLALPARSLLAGVVTGNDGAPVRGACVRAASAGGFDAATTDAQGRFVIHGLDDRPAWTLKASAEGYEPTTLEAVYLGGRGIRVVLRKREPIRCLVTRDGRPYEAPCRIRMIPARAVDLARGERIGSVPLAYGTSAGRAFHGSRGAFALHRPDERRYLVQAVSADGALASAPRPAVEGTPEPIELALLPAHETRGVAVDAEGRPAADSAVSLHAYAGGAVVAFPVASTGAGADGAYVLPPVPAGRYLLRAASPAGETTLDVTLPVAGGLRTVIGR